MLLDEFGEASEKTPTEESPFHLIEEESSKKPNLVSLYKELEQLKQKNAEFEKRIQDLSKPTGQSVEQKPVKKFKQTKVKPVSSNVISGPCILMGVISEPNNIPIKKRINNSKDAPEQPKKKKICIDEATRKLKLEKLAQEERARKERDEKIKQDQKEKNNLLALKNVGERVPIPAEMLLVQLTEEEAKINLLGSRKYILADNVTITGNYNRIKGNNVIIVGNFNILLGSAVVVEGANNKIYGDVNGGVFGKANFISGSLGLLVGVKNKFCLWPKRIDGFENKHDTSNATRLLTQISVFATSFNTDIATINNCLADVRPVDTDFLTVYAHPKGGQKRTPLTIASPTPVMPLLPWKTTELHTPFVELVKSEVDEPKEGRPKCAVCMDNPTTILLFPCKHVCLCNVCLEKLPKGVCPICNGRIVRHETIYIV